MGHSMLRKLAAAVLIAMLLPSAVACSQTETKSPDAEPKVDAATSHDARLEVCADFFEALSKANEDDWENVHKPRVYSYLANPDSLESDVMQLADGIASTELTLNWDDEQVGITINGNDEGALVLASSLKPGMPENTVAWPEHDMFIDLTEVDGQWRISGFDW